MDIIQILKYLTDIAIPVAILIAFVMILFFLFRDERRRHWETRTRLDDIHSRIEERLYHEIDELEKLLREERVKQK